MKDETMSLSSVLQVPELIMRNIQTYFSQYLIGIVDLRLYQDLQTRMFFPCSNFEASLKGDGLICMIIMIYRSFPET